MKILVVATVPNELKVIKEWIKSAWIKEKLEIDYLCCGIWNYETISSLEHYLTENKEPTFIWNIWICGYWNPKKEKKSDPIQVASVANVHTQKELIIPPFLQIAPLESCLCGEVPIDEIWKLCFENRIMDDKMFFDMESRWIELVASKYKYPRLILKIPFLFIENYDKNSRWRYRDLSMWNFEILRNLPYNNYVYEIISWINKQ